MNILFGDKISPEQLSDAGFDIAISSGMKVKVGSVYEGPCSIKTTILEIRQFGAFSYINGRGRFSNVSIGRYCSIAENVAIGYPEHPSSWLSTSSLQYMRPGWMKNYGTWETLPHQAVALTEIGNDVWIGAGAFLRAGIKVGTGAIIGAHAVVTRDVDPYAIIVGNPGRCIRHRVKSTLIDKLLASAWWDYSPAQLDGCPFDQPAEALEFLRKLRSSEMPVFEGPTLIIKDDGPNIMLPNGQHQDPL